MLKRASFRQLQQSLDQRLQALGVGTADLDHRMDALPQHPLMKKWWAYMGDIMRGNPDGSPVAEPLPCMFHLD